MAPSELRDLGEQAVVAVVAGIAQGAPLVKCQLLASRFYDELKRELRKIPQLDVAERRALVAAADHCQRVASAGINPNAMLDELKRAIAALPGHVSLPSPIRGRPVLRVIEGGLSKI
jgi:hypothetical protein